MEKTQLTVEFTKQDLRKLIVPLVIEQLLAITVGLCDSVMVSQVGEAAISAVSLVDTVNVLLVNAFSALATGGAVIAGQYLGRREQDKAGHAGEQLLLFMTEVSLAVMVLFYLCKGFVLGVVFGQVEPDVAAYANTYYIIVEASIPFLAIYNAGAALFRVMGNSKISMWVSLGMNLVNVTGNAILIFGLHRGVEGVAIPTLVSRMVAAVIIIALLCNPNQLLHIERTFRYKFNWQMVKKILSIGVPNGLENSMFQLGKILVLSLVSTFGTYAIAANAVGNAIALFQILPGMAISLAVTTVIARCVGAGDYEQVKYYNRKLMVITYVCMAATVFFIFSILPLIIKAYNLSDVTARATEQIIHFHGISAILIWPISFTLPATFRASGDAKACMYISILSMWIFRIAFSYVLGKYMGLGVFGVWVAMVIDWVFRALCFVIRYFKGTWRKSVIV